MRQSAVFRGTPMCARAIVCLVGGGEGEMLRYFLCLIMVARCTPPPPPPPSSRSHHFHIARGHQRCFTLESPITAATFVDINSKYTVQIPSSISTSAASTADRHPLPAAAFPMSPNVRTAVLLPTRSWSLCLRNVHTGPSIFGTF